MALHFFALILLIVIFSTRESRKVKVSLTFVCLSVCVVRMITFEPFDLLTLFLLCKQVTTVSRSSSDMKVIGSSSRSQ